MATTANTFKPTTDTFGELTLRAAHIHNNVMVGAWNRVRPLTPSRNMMIAVGFIAACVLAASALFAVDQSSFAHHDLPTYYGGVAIDAD